MATLATFFKRSEAMTGAQAAPRVRTQDPYMLRPLYAEFGYFYSKRIDMKLTPQLKEALAQKLANPPSELDGHAVRDVNTSDGVKLIFDDSTWLLFRLSGTEPVARVYAEACSPKDLKHILDAGRKFVAV